MVGIGLRLDTAWDATANLLLLAAVALGVASLRPAAGHPFVPGDESR